MLTCEAIPDGEEVKTAESGITQHFSLTYRHVKALGHCFRLEASNSHFFFANWRNLIGTAQPGKRFEAKRKRRHGGGQRSTVSAAH